MYAIKGVTWDKTGKIEARPLFKPRYIVVHYTAVPCASARAVAKSMIRRRKESTHFIIDDLDTVQLLPPTLKAAHVGDGTVNTGYALAGRASEWHETHSDFKGNSNSIGVDLCVLKKSNKTLSAQDDDWYFSPVTIKRAVVFVADLAKSLDIPPENIIRHADATGKPCPRPFVTLKGDKTDGDRDWRVFKQRIADRMNQAGSR